MEFFLFCEPVVKKLMWLKNSRTSVRVHCKALYVFMSFGGGLFSLEQFIFLGVLLDQFEDICDGVQKLCEVRLIIIIFGLFLVIVGHVVHRGGSLNSDAPVRDNLDSFHHAVLVA